MDPLRKFSIYILFRDYVSELFMQTFHMKNEFTIK